MSRRSDDPTGIIAGADAFADKMQAMGGRMLNQPVIFVDPVDPADPLPFGEAHGPFGGDFVVCEICRIPLTKFTAADGTDVEWLHTRSWEDHDHDPVPVVGEQGDHGQSACDFCAQVQQTHWNYQGDRIRIRDGNTIRDYGTTWSACESCARHIESGDRDALFEHVYRNSPSRKAGKIDRETAAAAWLPIWDAFLPTVHSRSYVGPRVEPAKLSPRLMPKIQIGLMRFWRSEQVRVEAPPAMLNKSVPLPGVHVGDENEFIWRFPPGVAVPEAAWLNHCDHLAAGIGTADLYWISENFTRLSIRAGKRFEKMVVTREELPSPFGIMVFAEPVGEIARGSSGLPAYIRAVTWTLVPRGVWLNLYVQGEDGVPGADVVEMRMQLGYLSCPNGGSGFDFGVEIPAPEPGQYDFITTILAAWALLKQPGVAGIEQAPVDKKYARSYQREYRRPVPPVHLVDLRKRPRPAHKPDGGSGKQWTERRIVHGHWKRQFYGEKRGLRKWIYVDDYVAGPDGAPLREPRPEVKILR